MISVAPTYTASRMPTFNLHIKQTLRFKSLFADRVTLPKLVRACTVNVLFSALRSRPLPPHKYQCETPALLSKSQPVPASPVQSKAFAAVTNRDYFASVY